MIVNLLLNGMGNRISYHGGKDFYLIFIRILNFYKNLLYIVKWFDRILKYNYSHYGCRLAHVRLGPIGLGYHAMASL